MTPNRAESVLVCEGLHKRICTFSSLLSRKMPVEVDDEDTHKEEDAEDEDEDDERRS